MGCATSKQARRDRRRSPAHYFRSRSMPVVHNHKHIAGGGSRVGDSDRQHIVALTSSTLGSLRLDSDCYTAGSSVVSDDESMMKTINDDAIKALSDMIGSKIPNPQYQTPAARARTPEHHEAETINAWELMEGLEEDASSSPSPKPLWMKTPGAEDSIVSEFDADILSNFRKALDQLSPEPQPLLRRSPSEPARRSKPCEAPPQQPKVTGIVKARISAFQQKIDARRAKKWRSPPNGEKKVVLYFTSLRGVRKTFEDCWSVKVILQGYGVRVDERDVSMHGGFKEELNEMLGFGFGGGRLPRVYADGRYLGGAEEVRQMHEAGELGRALEGCEAAAAAGKGGGVCEGCGGVRFVPCENCSGSCKVFVEEFEDEDEEETAAGGGGFRRCPDCNENGLVMCSYCL